MPTHNFKVPKGTLSSFETADSPLLENLLGDPLKRTVAVYLPEGIDPEQDYPMLVDLAGFTGSGLSHLAWKGFGETLPQRHPRSIAEELSRATDVSEAVTHIASALFTERGLERAAVESVQSLYEVDE